MSKIFTDPLDHYYRGHVHGAEGQPLSQPKIPMLHRAEDLINGQRQADYGDKLANFSQIAMGFQMVLAAKLAPGSEISPEDVALCMMQVKIARLAKSPDHSDSILDIAGYAGCYDKLQEERKEITVNNGSLPGAIYDSREPKF